VWVEENIVAGYFVLSLRTQIRLHLRLVVRPYRVWWRNTFRHIQSD